MEVQYKQTVLDVKEKERIQEQLKLSIQELESKDKINNLKL